MTLKEFYRRIEEGLAPALSSMGFAWHGEGEFKREGAEGKDRIALDPDVGRPRFAVLMCFYPEYMRPVFDLHPDEQQGFSCGPYLNPVAVTQREKWWPSKTVARLNQSLLEVEQTLKRVGFPWLDSLRDPVFYANSIDRNVRLQAAHAYEYIGDYETARAFYLSLFEMHQKIIELGKGKESLLLEEDGRRYVFVCAKLGRDEDRRRRVAEAIGYDKKILPLP